VVRCVVGDEVDLGSTIVPDQLAQKLDKRLGVKHFYEAGMPLWFGADPDGAHDFDTLSNRRAEHVNPDSDERPCSDDRARLLKDRFISVEHYTSFLLGFFLISGSSSRNHVC
jgi:hypothetical protein